MQIINPATEEIIRDVPEDNEQSIREKYERLRSAQPGWAATPLRDRLIILEKFHAALESEKSELAATLTAEMGKPIRQAHNELAGGRARIAWFLANSERWLADEWITAEGATREKIVYEPLGVVANISAWNYPYLVGVNVFVPALLAGNTVLYKPSEFATLTGLHIAGLLERAGLPENCFHVVTGGGAAGAAVLALPVDGVFFTGSYRTGKAIATQMAGRLIPVQLELGGKDPLYVMDDVKDVAAVAADALEGVVYNSGQSCCAVERIYVHRKIFVEFSEAYAAGCRALRTGDPLAEGTDIGPLTRQAQVDLLDEQIRDAVSKGATLLCGGRSGREQGYYMEPAALTGVDHSMKIMTEESFGPIVGIQPVEEDEEAVRLMLDTVYGLTAAVYSDSFERAERVMRRMQTGTVYWNCCDRVSAALPWSGRKNSGLGSTLSYQGIRAFVQPKSYHLRG